MHLTHFEHQVQRKKIYENHTQRNKVTEEHSQQQARRAQPTPGEKSIPNSRKESKEQKEQCQLQAETYEGNDVSMKEVGPMTRNKDTESHRRMAAEQGLKVAKKENTKLRLERGLIFSESSRVEKTQVQTVKKSLEEQQGVTQKQQKEQQTVIDRCRNQVDSRERFRRTET